MLIPQKTIDRMGLESVQIIVSHKKSKPIKSTHSTNVIMKHCLTVLFYHISIAIFQENQEFKTMVEIYFLLRINSIQH